MPRRKKKVSHTSSAAKSSASTSISATVATAKPGLALKTCATRPKLSLALPLTTSLGFTMGRIPMADTLASTAAARASRLPPSEGTWARAERQGNGARAVVRRFRGFPRSRFYKGSARTCTCITGGEGTEPPNACFYQGAPRGVELVEEARVGLAVFQVAAKVAHPPAAPRLGQLEVHPPVEQKKPTRARERAWAPTRARA